SDGQTGAGREAKPACPTDRPGRSKCEQPGGNESRANYRSREGVGIGEYAARSGTEEISVRNFSAPVRARRTAKRHRSSDEPGGCARKLCQVSGGLRQSGRPHAQEKWDRNRKAATGDGSDAL